LADQAETAGTSALNAAADASMNNRQSYLDSMNAGRRRRPSTSLEQLSSTLDELESETLLQDAVLRRFEILGEAARRVSDETQQRFSSIPWQPIIAMRISSSPSTTRRLRHRLADNHQRPAATDS